jgi:hypothetical protein
VSIVQIIIRHVRKIPLAYPESIRLWTAQPVAAFYVSLIVILVIIILLSKKKNKSRHPSSLHSVFLLHNNVIWTPKCRGNISEGYTTVPTNTDWA